MNKDREAFELFKKTMIGNILSVSGRRKIADVVNTGVDGLFDLIVPDGFVVVPKKELLEVLSNASDAMGDEECSSVYRITGTPSTWFDHHTVAENAVMQAVKAQEQSHG